MSIWLYLVLTEIIPLGLFIVGGLYESKSTKYPDMKIGYKNKYSTQSSLAWEYSNKLVAKLNGSVGTLLFIVNAVLLFIIGESAFTFLLAFNLFMVVLSRLMIDNIIKKKFDKE
ncbi:hypothetical protein GNF83_17310 [Clostridium perfringens]|uniref:SdpI family protein n=1 Tax=Clostridium perfringens TaxID=1502 RepID=A0AAW9KB24_CLOPF|nr:hypothetical protein [Clostridium perfringens]